MSHTNAVLTPMGRLRLARLVVDDGWVLRRAAERFGVSVTTARRWSERYRLYGRAGMVDRSSRPRSSPHRLPQRTERRIVELRVTHRWGPARIAYRLGLNPSTVHKVLRRYNCPPLRWVDSATGCRIKTSRADTRRYEHLTPGDLVHVDIKKLGRIPHGGGHRVLGRAEGVRNKVGTAANRRLGYAFLHNAVDDYSRLAYTEILTDDRKDTAAGFWMRANAWFNSMGITVKRVLTDNGSCYRSDVFKTALGENISHKRTRPYRLQTNGKVERFNRTLLEEWAYARTYTSEAERVKAFPTWLHHYNHHRGHTSLNGQPPATRVPNLPGQNS
uniref:IS481 family transposase n=1 Tax=Tessaracoccus timonensis TaxID=2161816 RepID=UPI000D561070|nr:IS481 family transposase [Tessaracoccus timonensis]